MIQYCLVNGQSPLEITKAYIWHKLID